MTAARQERKPAFYVGWPLWPWHGYFRTLWPLGSLFGPLESRPATDNQLAVNATTGLAISSFDPVACFTEGKALFGRPEFELNLDGAVWRFSNEGNRGAFEKHRDVYAPCFAGYDPVAIGRGRSGPGHPLIWTVAGQRLYLFYSEQTRASFLADPGRIIDTAERKWPDLAGNLGQ